MTARLRHFPLMALIALLTGPAGAQDAEPSPPSIEGVVVAPGFVLPQLSALAQTRERPLFSPGRRPPPAREETAEAPPPAPPAAAPPGPPPFELAGIVTGGASAFAILRDRETQAIERAKPGEVVKGWTLSELGAKYVVLVQDDRSVRITLFEVREGEPPRRPPPRLKRSNRSRNGDDDDDDDEDDE